MSKKEPGPERERLDRIIVRAGKIKVQTQEAVTEATLTWGVDQVTQLQMRLEDPGFVIWKSALFEKNTPILYRDEGMKPIALRVTSLVVDGGGSATGGFTVNARSEGVWKLRRRRGPKVMRQTSPSEFVRAECKAVGLNVVTQNSPTRSQVARDVPQKGQEDVTGASKPSSWTTFLRLAQELGFYCYEFGDTIFFGKPKWLISKMDENPMRLALPLPGAPAKLLMWEVPVINDSDDADPPVEISNIKVGKDRLAECRPGSAVKILGLPPYNDDYLLNTMTMPLLGTGPIELTAITPTNPEPQPPSKPSRGGGSDGDDYDDGEGGATQTGTRSAYDFVSMAITASGASYVYGAEAVVSDSTPSALDCSELIQWALGRVGVPFVDGSAAQISACNDIPVATAFRTRGALLYKPGHIGISMGDGRSVEARNPTDGVGIFRAADIGWTDGGLVPGLRYG